QARPGDPDEARLDPAKASPLPEQAGKLIHPGVRVRVAAAPLDQEDGRPIARERRDGFDLSQALVDGLQHLRLDVERSTVPDTELWIASPGDRQRRRDV